MRHARVKPSDQDTWHHCYNRTVGTAHDRPFSAADKEQFIRILLRVSTLYFVQPVAFQVMDNHFHLLLRTPAQPPSEEETCRRYEAYYRGKRHLTPGTAACRRWQARLRDVSWYLRLIQQLYTMWYNRTRPVPRRGTLWADRFKNTVLETGSAVWCCLLYIENNAVRAGLVANASEYRFGSFGRWLQSGRHPFADNVLSALLPMLQSLLGLADLPALRQALGQALAEAHADHNGTTLASSSANPPDSLSATASRLRYWVDGLVIGSELFVRRVMAGLYGSYAARRRLANPSDLAPDGSLWAWRRLRPLPVT